MCNLVKYLICLIIGFSLAISASFTNAIASESIWHRGSAHPLHDRHHSRQNDSIFSAHALPSRHPLELLEAGRAYYKASQFKDALGAWQTAAEGFQQQGDRLYESLALSYVSLAYQYLGQWEEAEHAIVQSLIQLDGIEGVDSDHFTDEQMLVISGQVLNTQGSLQFAQGILESALDTWQQSASFYQQAGESRRYVGSLINQARALQALGYFLQARTLLNQAKMQLDHEEDVTLQVLGLHSLGDVLQAIGEWPEAEQVLTEGIAIAQSHGMTGELAALLISKGQIAQAQQDSDTALAAYHQAATLQNNETQRVQAQINEFGLLVDIGTWDAATVLAQDIQPKLTTLTPNRSTLYAQINFAHHLMQLPDLQDATAATLLAKTAQEAQAIGDRHAETYALGYLGNAYEQTQQWAIAQELTETALLIAQNLNAPDILYQWQWQLARILKAQGKEQGALSAYDTAFRSLQALRYDLAATTPDQQFSFQESVEPVYRDYVDLLLNPSTDPSPRRLQQAREVIESLQLAELNNFFNRPV